MFTRFARFGRAANDAPGGGRHDGKALVTVSVPSGESRSAGSEMAQHERIASIKALATNRPDRARD
jgi:hypothetical protein